MSDIFGRWMIMYFIFFLNNIKKNIGESLFCNKWSSNDSTRAAGASLLDSSCGATLAQRLQTLVLVKGRSFVWMYFFSFKSAVNHIILVNNSQ